MTLKDILTGFMIAFSVCFLVSGLATFFLEGRVIWSTVLGTALGVGIAVPVFTAVTRKKK